MRKLRWLIICCILGSSGCSTLSSKPNVIGEHGGLSFYTRLVENKLVVFGVVNGAIDDTRGIKIGDSIVGYNGKRILNLVDRQAYKRYVRDNAGSKIILDISREGKEFPVEQTIKKVPIYDNQQILVKLEDELLSQKKVSLAVVVSKINHVGFLNNEDGKKRSEAVKTLIQPYAEKFYIDNLGMHENFFLVDRTKTEEILKELNFQATGAVSTEFVRDFGKLAGVTDMVFIDWTSNRYSREDTISSRLINVEDGTVTAVHIKNFAWD